MMAIKLLIMYGVKEIMLAGFDGYSHNTKENYINSQMEFINKNVILDAMNFGMSKVLCELSKIVKISFLTEQKYVKL